MAMVDIDLLVDLLPLNLALPVHQKYTHNLIWVVTSWLFLAPILETFRDRMFLLIVGFSHLFLDDYHRRLFT